MKTTNRPPIVLLSSLLVLLAAACDPVGEQPQGQTGPSPAAVQAEPEGDHRHAEGERPAAAEAPLQGQQAVGEAVSDSVELVDAADIIANPDQFAGRTVRIAGQVKGYCHHRRAWFAIDVPGATPPYLRVLTEPAFLVPEGVMNAQATAVGVVEVQETPGSRVHHYEQEHQLGSGSDDGVGRAKRAVIRATGAEFGATPP